MIKKLLAMFAAVIAAVAMSAPSSAVQTAALNVDNKGNITETSEAAVYGWKWNEVVDVYDNTGGISPHTKVSESAREWDKRSGIVVRMTNNKAEANVVVEFRDGICGSGCAYFAPVSNGVASGTCYATLMPITANMPAAEILVIHEIGHCIGLAHAPQSARSVMTPTTSAYDFYTRPQAYDYKDMKSLYGR